MMILSPLKSHIGTDNLGSRGLVEVARVPTADGCPRSQPGSTVASDTRSWSREKQLCQPCPHPARIHPLNVSESPTFGQSC